jgi:hypothetical protein
MQNTPQSGVRDPELIASRHNDGTTTAPAVEGCGTKSNASDATAILALLHEMNRAIAAVSSQIASVDARVASTENRLMFVENRLDALDEGLVLIQGHTYACNVYLTMGMAALEAVAGPLGCRELVSALKAEAERFIHQAGLGGSLGAGGVERQDYGSREGLVGGGSAGEG